MTLKRFAKIVFVCAFLLYSSFSFAQDIRVAAAADLNYALSEAAERWEFSSGKKAQITFGSSGNLYQQIRSGAPYDIFFSADVDYPRQLSDSGLADPSTLAPYAQGKLVLWAPKSAGIDVNQGLKVLVSAAVKHVAIANPEHAPYGRAAVAALKSAGIYEQVAPKLIYGENISQAAQFANSGNAEAGLIALSLTFAPAMKPNGSYWLVPQGLYPPILQGEVLLKSSANPVAAKSFLEFMLSPEMEKLMRGYGFEQPANNKVSSK